MRGINAVEAIELALLYVYRSMGDTRVLKSDVDNYRTIINDNLMKQYGDLWYQGYNAEYDDNIFTCEYGEKGQRLYRLKDEYIENPKKIQYKFMNYSFQTILEASKENALNTIGLSKDKDNNIKRLCLKK